MKCCCPSFVCTWWGHTLIRKHSVHFRRLIAWWWQMVSFFNVHTWLLFIFVFVFVFWTVRISDSLETTNTFGQLVFDQHHHYACSPTSLSVLFRCNIFCFSFFFRLHASSDVVRLLPWCSQPADSFSFSSSLFFSLSICLTFALYSFFFFNRCAHRPLFRLPAHFKLIFFVTMFPIIFLLFVFCFLPAFCCSAFFLSSGSCISDLVALTCTFTTCAFSLHHHHHHLVYSGSSLIWIFAHALFCICN